MGSGRPGWSVFDGVRAFPPAATPEVLMAELDAAIAAHEHARVTALLSSEEVEQGASPSSKATAHDARLADEAYKAACAALAAGRPGAALRSLRVALASCPPDKPSALAKLRSLLSIASAQHRQQQLQQSWHASPSS